MQAANLFMPSANQVINLLIVTILSLKAFLCHALGFVHGLQMCKN